MNERIIAVPILMIGVAVFSFIMGQFIEILMNYNSLWAVGNRKDLSKWIALLSRFNNGKPLNKSLITKIENFFEYYWNNNKLAALQTDADNRFMDELPSSVQAQVFIDYLFTDFLYKYRNYLNPKMIKRESKIGSKRMSTVKSTFIDSNIVKHRDFLV